jgi:hypothetical protein
MQFHIDTDTADSVTGWVLPENPSATPSIVVSLDGGEPLKIEANVYRQDLKDLGVHHTGMVGFRIDQSVVAGFSAAGEVAIHDAESDILLHCRFRETRHIAAKLMRYELAAMPQVIIDNALASRFTLHYAAVERHSFDTLFSVINNQSAKSIYISGRPALMRYVQPLRDRDFKIVAMLRDPIEELAERILFLKFVTSGKGANFLVRHLTGLTPLLDLAARIDLNDFNSLPTVLNSLTEAESDAIANPFVRTLACSVDEIVEQHHLSIALENLASLDVVGVQTKVDQYWQDINRLLGTTVLADERPAVISSAAGLAEKLRNSRAVHKLLALDVRLYQLVSEAVEKCYA